MTYTDEQLVEQFARLRHNPLAFVMFAFPWGEKGGRLEHRALDDWQVKFLQDLGRLTSERKFNGIDAVEPIRMAAASGHGIGKSAMVAFLHWWIMCTRPGAKGRVTANTFPQLSTTTWAEIQKWHSMLICKDWFEISNTVCRAKERPTEWFSVPLTCAPENSEAFAGQHNVDSTSFFLFDEASLIPDIIWEVAAFGLTDGEPMWFVMGNPTRNTGAFYEACFGQQSHWWNARSIDSRTCRFPNHEEQQKWIDQFGLDSDTVRMRILGLPPKQSEDQLIGWELVHEAQQRRIATDPDSPLVAGVDVPDGGSAWFVVRFRRGFDSRPGPLIPRPIRVAGSRTDRQAMTDTLATLLHEERPDRKISAMFIDSAFGAPILERLRASKFDNVFEVSFGGKSPDPRYGNMRAFMWAKKMKDWLALGAIDPEDKELAQQLAAPGFHRKVGGDGSLIVESKDDMKARGIASPDDADALALTFARAVGPVRREFHKKPSDKGMMQPW